VLMYHQIVASPKGIFDQTPAQLKAELTRLYRQGYRTITAADLVARAGALTVANDLLPATAMLVPALVPFRRAVSRLLGRPIGLSGSGPTLWSLYASESEAQEAADTLTTAVADGRLAPPGDAPAVVHATHIQTGHEQGSPS